MQDIIQTPFVQNLLSKVSYIVSMFTALMGMVNVQNLAIIIGIVFTALTYIGNRTAVKARRREEQERHQWDKEFHAERQRRLQTGESLHWVEPLASNPAPLKADNLGNSDA